MSIHRPPSVKEQPFVLIERWCVFELEDGDRHLAGFIFSEGQGRVTSKLIAFDPVERVFTTRSGRRYKLYGQSGFHPDAAYVKSVWLKTCGQDKSTDVSNDYDE